MSDSMIEGADLSPAGLPLSPRLAFFHGIAWILLLVILAIGYGAQPGWSWLPHYTFSFEGVLPLWVPWAGAAGGTTISLVGVAWHAVDWDAPRYSFWHLTRHPFLGAVCGTVTVFIVVLFLNTVSPRTEGGGYTPSGTAVLTVIAFVVGYREATFRELITKVVDTIVGPGETPATAVVSVVPSIIDFGSVEISKSVQRAALLANAGKDTISVGVGDIRIEPTDGFILGITKDSEITPSSSLSIPITWTPTVAGQTAATLEVVARGQRFSVALRGTATSAQAADGGGGVP